MTGRKHLNAVITLLSLIHTVAEQSELWYDDHGVEGREKLEIFIFQCGPVPAPDKVLLLVTTKPS